MALLSLGPASADSRVTLSILVLLSHRPRDLRISFVGGRRLAAPRV